MADSDPLCLTQQIPNNPIKKRKNDSRYEEEIIFSNNWSRTGVKSSMRSGRYSYTMNLF
jgi:hypothetical protein